MTGGPAAHHLEAWKWFPVKAWFSVNKELDVFLQCGQCAALAKLTGKKNAICSFCLFDSIQNIVKTVIFYEHTKINNLHLQIAAHVSVQYAVQ